MSLDRSHELFQVVSVSDVAQESLMELQKAETTKPPYYRRVHKHHKAKHLLQDEFPVRNNSELCYFVFILTIVLHCLNLECRRRDGRWRAALPRTT